MLGRCLERQDPVRSRPPVDLVERLQVLLGGVGSLDREVELERGVIDAGERGGSGLTLDLHPGILEPVHHAVDEVEQRGRERSRLPGPVAAGCEPELAHEVVDVTLRGDQQTCRDPAQRHVDGVVADTRREVDERPLRHGLSPTSLQDLRPDELPVVDTLDAPTSRHVADERESPARHGVGGGREPEQPPRAEVADLEADALRDEVGRDHAVAAAVKDGVGHELGHDELGPERHIVRHLARDPTYGSPSRRDLGVARDLDPLLARGASVRSPHGARVRPRHRHQTPGAGQMCNDPRPADGGGGEGVADGPDERGDRGRRGLRVAHPRLRTRGAGVGHVACEPRAIGVLVGARGRARCTASGAHHRARSPGVSGLRRSTGHGSSHARRHHVRAPERLGTRPHPGRCHPRRPHVRSPPGRAHEGLLRSPGHRPPGAARPRRRAVAARDFDLGIMGPPISVSMGFIGAGLVDVLGGAAQAVALATVTWWGSLLIAGAWLSTHWFLRDSTMWANRNDPEVQQQQRHAEYSYRLAVDSGPAKEIRVFGLGRVGGRPLRHTPTEAARPAVGLDAPASAVAPHGVRRPRCRPCGRPGAAVPRCDPR